MKIENIETSKLIPYVNNAKKHTDEQVSQIASSIKEFGFNNPILIDKDFGVIAGHGRLLGAKKLELAKVPCLKLGHLTESQKKAYILADNRLGELSGGWDESLLKLELESIMADDSIDFDLTGFNADDLNSILDDDEDEPDYDALNDDEIDDEIDRMEGETRKAIMIEFPLDDYEVAQDLVSQAREKDMYIGALLISTLRKELSE